jgi:DNA-binding NarL/FixJ family response regulator
MAQTRIVLVEDDPEVRSRFAQLLGAEPGFSIAGSFGDVETARAFLLHTPVDVLLVDLGLPDGDGISLIRLCAGYQPACETAVVTVFSDSERVFACLEAGATGYILKDEMPAGIVESVRMLLEGRSPVSPSIARRVLSRFGGGAQAPGGSADSKPGGAVRSGRTGRRPAVEGAPSESLSPREIEILELVAKGLSVNEIARLLSLSSHTVGTHVKNIYRKLSVHSRTEALFEARGLGLLRGR